MDSGLIEIGADVSCMTTREEWYQGQFERLGSRSKIVPDIFSGHLFASYLAVTYATRPSGRKGSNTWHSCAKSMVCD